MANADFTLQSTEETRAGAIACMGALLAIERIESDKSDLTMSKYWRIQDAAVAAMIDAAGEQSSFMTGFLATLAEYSLTSIESGILNLQKWKPEASMSDVEKFAYREAFAREVEGVTE